MKMKLKLKLIMLTLGVGTVMQLIGSCGRWWGDVVGDIIFLNGVD